MKHWSCVRDGEIEKLLAIMLRGGTVVACLIFAGGLVLDLLPDLRSVADDFGKVGIAVFISLPILRVSIMAIAFLKNRDLLFAAISTSVLAVICAGAVLGVKLASVAP